jgi:FixJ family two-component response regulator
MNEAPVIHVVDDDDSMRKALTRLLTANGYQARAYSSAGEFLMAQPTDDIGCVLLDVSMPGPSGLELHEALAKHETPLPVIFLTGHGSISMSVRAMKAGAVDFLTKPLDKDTLMKAIEKGVALGRQRRTTTENKHDLRMRYEKLTMRERQVFTLVTEGLLNKQIAAELGMSERTVKAHRAQVKEKMLARSVVVLARIADQLKVDRVTSKS